MYKYKRDPFVKECYDSKQHFQNLFAIWITSESVFVAIVVGYRGAPKHAEKSIFFPISPGVKPAFSWTRWTLNILEENAVRRSMTSADDASLFILFKTVISFSLMHETNNNNKVLAQCLMDEQILFVAL